MRSNRKLFKIKIRLKMMKLGCLEPSAGKINRKMNKKSKL